MDALEKARKLEKQVCRRGTIQEKAIALADYLLTEFDDLVFEEENIKKWADEIYRAIHSANKYNTCYSVHKDWREETQKKLSERLK